MLHPILRVSITESWLYFLHSSDRITHSTSQQKKNGIPRKKRGLNLLRFWCRKYGPFQVYRYGKLPFPVKRYLTYIPLRRWLSRSCNIWANILKNTLDLKNAEIIKISWYFKHSHKRDTRAIKCTMYTIMSSNFAKENESNEINCLIQYWNLRFITSSSLVTISSWPASSQNSQATLERKQTVL